MAKPFRAGRPTNRNKSRGFFGTHTTGSKAQGENELRKTAMPTSFKKFSELRAHLNNAYAWNVKEGRDFGFQSGSGKGYRPTVGSNPQNQAILALLRAYAQSEE